MRKASLCAAAVEGRCCFRPLDVFEEKFFICVLLASGQMHDESWISFVGHLRM